MFPTVVEMERKAALKRPCCHCFLNKATLISCRVWSKLSRETISSAPTSLQRFCGTSHGFRQPFSKNCKELCFAASVAPVLTYSNLLYCHFIQGMTWVVSRQETTGSPFACWTNRKTGKQLVISS